MIFTLIFGMVELLVIVVFGFFPVVEFLPFGLDSIMVQGISLFRRLAEFYPPFVAFILGLMFYLMWRIILMLAKILLGARSPIN